MRRLYYAIAFAFLVMAQVAHAEDQCRDILSHGMSDSATKIRDKTLRQAETTFYCSSTFNEARRYHNRQQSSGGDANANVGYGPFSFGAGGSTSSADSVTEDNFNKWYAANCGTSSSSSNAKDYEYLAQSNVNEGIVKAWQACMSDRAVREGLVCYASPQADAIEITVLWRRQSALQAAVMGSTLRGGQSLFDGAAAGRLLPNGLALNPGEIIVPVDRSDKQRVSASINVSHGGQNFACAVYVPPIIPPPPVAKNVPKASVLARALVSNPRFGCTADPMGSKCQKDATIAPSTGYAICRIDVSYVEGPTQYARWYNSREDRTSITVHVEADPDRVLFSGTHQWAYVKYDATEIIAGATPEDRGAATCNVK